MEHDFEYVSVQWTLSDLLVERKQNFEHVFICRNCLTRYRHYSGRKTLEQDVDKLLKDLNEYINSAYYTRIKRNCDEQFIADIHGS